MSYTITEIQIIGQSYTIDLSTIITAPIPCTGGIYSASASSNVQIDSVVGSIVTYTPLLSGSFEFIGTLSCSEGSAVIQVLGDAVTFQATVSQPSATYNFSPCCLDCFNPIILGDLYEGATYIPFSLDMEDGTVVNVITSGTGQGIVLNGRGVIELSAALTVGDSIQLQVGDSACKAVSEIVIAKAVSEDCDQCLSPNKCHIRLLNVSVNHVGVNLVALSALSVESFGELRYRLDNGDWVADWASIGSFSSLVNHVLGIKLVNNPSCRIEYPFLAISYT